VNELGVVVALHRTLACFVLPRSPHLEAGDIFLKMTWPLYWSDF
jgi:hypothetical protein